MTKKAPSRRTLPPEVRRILRPASPAQVETMFRQGVNVQQLIEARRLAYSLYAASSLAGDTSELTRFAQETFSAWGKGTCR